MMGVILFTGFILLLLKTGKPREEPARDFPVKARFKDHVVRRRRAVHHRDPDDDDDDEEDDW